MSMSRIVVWWIAFVLIVAVLAAQRGYVAGAQDAEPQATIVALRTRVAELEALITPTQVPGSPAASGGDSSGKLFGPALTLLPPGDPATLSVVLVGTYGTWLPIVVRNNTQDSVKTVKVSAAAYSADGELIGAGGSLEIQPDIIEPGGYGIGNVSFGFAELPADTRFEFEVDGERGGKPYILYDLTIADASYQGDRIVGTIANETEVPITHNPQVMFACFDETGALLEVDFTYSPDESVQPGETAIFQIGSLNFEHSSEWFLVTAAGFSNP